MLSPLKRDENPNQLSRLLPGPGSARSRAKALAGGLRDRSKKRLAARTGLAGGLGERPKTSRALSPWSAIARESAQFVTFVTLVTNVTNSSELPRAGVGKPEPELPALTTLGRKQKTVAPAASTLCLWGRCLPHSGGLGERPKTSRAQSPWAAIARESAQFVTFVTLVTNVTNSSAMPWTGVKTPEPESHLRRLRRLEATDAKTKILVFSFGSVVTERSRA